MRVFVNHIGFDGTDYKTAVLELEQEAVRIGEEMNRGR